jgi:thiol-disulfide isomerase/thioredoxin
MVSGSAVNEKAKKTCIMQNEQRIRVCMRYASTLMTKKGCGTCDNPCWVESKIYKPKTMNAILNILFYILISGIFSTADASTPGEVEVGGYLRAATLQGLNGKSRKFSEFKGKPLIINVWASWCGPCREEMSSLERLARRYNGIKLNVIGISTDDDTAAAAAYIKKAGVSFENYIDSKVFLENMLGADTIPLTLLVDAKGRVLRKVRGSNQWDSPEFLALIGETFGIGM